MPTSDDLTLSLTIKDNSNLDKLRKNLDSILKTGAPAMGVGPDFDDMKKKIDYFRSKIDYLVPTIKPAAHEQAALREYAGTVKLLLKDFKTEIASYLTPESYEYVKELMKTLGVPEGSMEDFRKAFEKSIEEIEREAELAFQGFWVGGKAKRFLDIVTNVISVIKTAKGGERLTAWREIFEAIPEAQLRFEKLMEALGATKIAQYGMFKISDDILKQSENFEEWLDEDKDEILSTLGHFFEGQTTPWKPLMKALHTLGYSEDINKILTDVNKIKDDVDLQKILKAFILAWRSGKYKGEMWLGTSFKDFIAGMTGKSPAEEKRFLDIAVVKNAENLIKAFPTLSEDSKKYIDEMGGLTLEIKNVLRGTSSVKAQLSAYQKIFGEALTVVARMITPQMRGWLETQKIKYLEAPSLREIEMTAGIPSILMDVKETLKKMEELASKRAEELDWESIKRTLGIMSEKVTTQADLREFFKKLLEALKGDPERTMTEFF